VEYRPYLWSDRFSFLGVDQIALQGCLFIDMGVLVNDSAAVHSELKNRSLGLLSAGLGLRLNFVRFAGAILRFDFARTISPDEGFGFSFGIGQFF
jgi:outer membrane protein assembly factor BamA